jgi:hypothetical protein
MQPKSSRSVFAIAAAAVALGLVAMSPAAALAKASPGPVAKFKVGAARSNTGINSNLAQALAATVKLATFKSTVTDSGKTYTYTMVGKNPAVAATNPSTTVKALLIPLVINFIDGKTWDPTVADSCDPGGNALARTQSSPVFVSTSWSFGGTPIGTVQYADAFQRANFWRYAMPTGINPGYNVNLALTTLAKVTINVPGADSAEAAIGCGNGLLAAVNQNWFDPFVQQTLIPSLASLGVNASVLPIFLLHNVVEYVGTTAQCCVLGYHNAFKTTSTSPSQTYAVAMYDNSGAFAGSSDISVLTHEVGEWLDDPLTRNPTRAWGHIGQVTGCQKNLEVGDPLSGTTIAVSLGGFTYHPQELAFFSWFYRQTPSLGVNGWYSSNGTFTGSQGTCH